MPIVPQCLFPVPDAPGCVQMNVGQEPRCNKKYWRGSLCGGGDGDDVGFFWGQFCHSVELKSAPTSKSLPASTELVRSTMDWMVIKSAFTVPLDNTTTQHVYEPYFTTSDEPLCSERPSPVPTSGTALHPCSEGCRCYSGRTSPSCMRRHGLLQTRRKLGFFGITTELDNSQMQPLGGCH
jgi:hypothetical protein